VKELLQSIYEMSSRRKWRQVLFKDTVATWRRRFIGQWTHRPTALFYQHHARPASMAVCSVRGMEARRQKAEKWQAKANTARYFQRRLTKKMQISWSD